MKRIMVAMGLMGALLVVAAGVAWAATVNCQVGVPCLGTDEPDELIGTTQPDDMDARQDDDLLEGFRGPDVMTGDARGLPLEDTATDGDDELFGGGGRDQLDGFGGSDLLQGGSFADVIFATDRENDTLNPGEDTVRGNRGNDFINAQDGFKDTISCGAEEDTVFFDEGIDVVADNCEIQDPNPPVLTGEAAQAQQEELASLSGR